MIYLIIGILIGFIIGYKTSDIIAEHNAKKVISLPCVLDNRKYHDEKTTRRKVDKEWRYFSKQLLKTLSKQDSFSFKATNKLSYEMCKFGLEQELKYSTNHTNFFAIFDGSLRTIHVGVKNV